MKTDRMTSLVRVLKRYADTTAAEVASLFSGKVGMSSIWAPYEILRDFQQALGL